MSSSEKQINRLNEIKKALKLADKDPKIYCRETEVEKLTDCYKKCTDDQKSFAAYLYGVPGTGKTSTALAISANFKSIKTHHINCSTVNEPILPFICKKLAVPVSASDYFGCLVKKFAKSAKNMHLIVLDELDSVTSKESINLLYEIPSQSFSRLSIVGISNSLDLSTKITNLNLITVDFRPYAFSDILLILNKKIPDEYHSWFDSSALQLCARKAASMGGDFRRAIDIILISVDLLIEQILHLECEGDKENIPPHLLTEKPMILSQHVIKAIEKVFSPTGTKSALSNSINAALPTIQQIVLSNVWNFFCKYPSQSAVSISQLHEFVSKNSEKFKLNRLSREELVETCEMLDSRALVVIEKSKKGRSSELVIKKLNCDTHSIKKVISNHLVDLFTN